VAHESESSLFADTVCHHHVKMVLCGADLGSMLPDIRANGPIGGDHQELDALEFYYSACFREAAIEADIDPDLSLQGLNSRSTLGNPSVLLFAPFACFAALRETGLSIHGLVHRF
jgi:hypothetical protein